MSGYSNIAEVITLFTPSELVGLDLLGTTVVVIDALRGSSTVIYALKNGATRVIPAYEIEDAKVLAHKWQTGEYVLCAERNGLKVSGFDLGNSPFEYTPEVVSGRDVIYSSTNCSKAMLAAYDADRVLVGTFNNLSACMEAINSQKRVILLCAGKMGRFALEDAVCAGMFANEFLRHSKTEVALNDASRTAKILFDYYHRDILKLLKESSHGSYLLQLGQEKDLELIAAIDSERIVPELSLNKTHFFATFIPKSNVTLEMDFLLSKEPVFRSTEIDADKK
jgi:2-phosphosulfolactate phosphatase